MDRPSPSRHRRFTSLLVASRFPRPRPGCTRPPVWRRTMENSGLEMPFASPLERRRPVVGRQGPVGAEGVALEFGELNEAVVGEVEQEVKLVARERPPLAGPLNL